MNPKNHRLSARLAAAVYIANEGDLRNELHHIGVCASVAEIVEGPAPLHERVLIVPTGEVVFVVFRGTQNRAQWMSNADARKRGLATRHEGTKAHRGFLTGLMTVLDSTLESMSIWRSRRMVVVGHSRGAGAAICFALLCATFGRRIEEVHLFGCPRTLNRLAADLFKRTFPRNCWNWVCNNDAVFRVPFRWMGFEHVGRIMYFDQRDRLHVDPSLGLKVRGQFLGRLSGGLFDGWSDHNAVKEYERLIGKLEF